MILTAGERLIINRPIRFICLSFMILDKLLKEISRENSSFTEYWTTLQKQWTYFIQLRNESGKLWRFSVSFQSSFGIEHELNFSTSHPSAFSNTLSIFANVSLCISISILEEHMFDFKLLFFFVCQMTFPLFEQWLSSLSRLKCSKFAFVFKIFLNDRF